MIRILRAIDGAPSGSGHALVVEALLDRRPLFLFPELEARGLAFVCEPHDGGYALTVRMTP